MDEKLDSKLGDKYKAQESWNLLNDVTFWIGVSLLTMGFFKRKLEIPDEFIIGASLGGLCFTVADVLSSSETYKRCSSPLVAIGTLCFFLLPFIILRDPASQITDLLELISDSATFFSLGIILIILAFKTEDSNIRYKREQEEEKKAYQNRLIKLEEELELLKANAETNKS